MLRWKEEVAGLLGAQKMLPKVCYKPDFILRVTGSVEGL